MLFIAHSPQEDVRQYVNRLFRFVMPTKVGPMLKAPGEYFVTQIDVTPTGVLSLHIGSWFAAKGKLVITGDPSPTYSKEVIARTGFPLFVAMTVQFTTYRNITYDEWQGFFTTGS
jgi:hypothetical protein